MKFVLHLFALGFACAVLAGCTSTRAKLAEPGRSLQGIRRFFVQRNLKDNHGIDQSIVRVLQARGLEASSGPITLLPDNAQTVIVYEDRWAWDFSNHMVYLKIGARDLTAPFPYVTAYYQKQVAFTTDVDEVVSQVIEELLKAGR